MLVLTRRPGEQIVIGNGIRVTVVSVGPGRVKIGVEAPPDVRIDRQEVHEKIQHEQEQAADVLAAVAEAPASAQSPTLGGSPETDVQIHNRIGDRLPAQATAGPATPPPVSVARLLKPRLPRKPR